MEPEVAEFCERVHPQLVGVLTVHCGRRDLAEETAQEALARAVAGWSRVRQMEHPVAWVHRVALNLMTSRWRRATTERRAIRVMASAPPLQFEDAQLEQMMLRDALASLPPRQRAAVALRYLADLSIADTALVLGCREGTVKSLTSQAVDALRGRLAQVRPAAEGEHVD
jgi:RNA polymerase sigma factor (sigma-70 family)